MASIQAKAIATALSKTHHKVAESSRHKEVSDNEDTTPMSMTDDDEEHYRSYDETAQREIIDEVPEEGLVSTDVLLLEVEDTKVNENYRLRITETYSTSR